MTDFRASKRRLLVLGYNATLTTAVEAPRQPTLHFDQIQVRACWRLLWCTLEAEGAVSSEHALTLHDQRSLWGCGGKLRGCVVGAACQRFRGPAKLWLCDETQRRALPKQAERQAHSDSSGAPTEQPQASKARSRELCLCRPEQQVTG